MKIFSAGLFERPFKIQKNGVFLFEISFFVLEILMFFSYANYQEHCFNIFRDIVYSVFYHFKCKQYDVITNLICIIEKHQYL